MARSAPVKRAPGKADATGVPTESAQHELKTLILSFHSVVAVDTVEEERVASLVAAVASELDMPVFEWTLTSGLTSQTTEWANRSTAQPLEVLQHLATLQVEGIFLLKDFARHLEDAAVCRAFRDVADAFARTHATLLVTGAGHAFPPDADAHVVHFEMALPGAEELEQVVATVARSLRDRTGADVTLSRAELGELVQALTGLTCNQARQAVARAILSDGRLCGEDVARVRREKAKALGQDGLLEYLPHEDNPFELGGFKRLREWLERARIGFTDQARELGLDPPRGILMVGVQGCGKSLAAKSIAREWRQPLLKLDAGRLYDKFIGESEKNLRRALETAEALAPCVLWIDELEKAFASVANGDQDGGTSQRIFATLLTWLQEKKEAVFVVATANDVFRLPPELMRKGRFDEIFFVDLPDASERADIFDIHLRRRKQEPLFFETQQLVDASAGFSGAEIEQAVIASLYAALYAGEDLTSAHLLRELDGTVPLSKTRREDVERLRAMAAERFVPVR